MLDIIDIDLPQLPVRTFQGTSILKEHLVFTNPEVYLYRYFPLKLEEISVRHSIINEKLQDIFIIHNKERSKRQDSPYYNIDINHYKQLQLVRTVVVSLRELTEELISMIYFAYYVKAFNVFAEVDNTDAQLTDLIMVNEIEKEINDYKNLYRELVHLSSTKFFVFDTTTELHTDNEPMIHLPVKKDFIFATLEKVPLAEVVNLYIQSFGQFNTLFNKIAPAGFIIH